MSISTLFYPLATLVLFVTACNDSGQKPTGQVQKSPSAFDSSSLYIDDVMDDSLLTFLNELPRDTSFSIRNVRLNKHISMSDCRDFIRLHLQKPDIFGSRSRLRKAVDSINKLTGALPGPKLSFRSLSSTSAYFSGLDAAQKSWADLILDLTVTALRLTSKSKVYQSEGSRAPKQYGLAYSWGSKNYLKRAIPSKQDSITVSGIKRPHDTCTYRIYGLDCSGFVSILFNSVGIKMVPGRAEEQRQEQYLNKILASFYGKDVLEATPLGHISSSQNQTGDIIYKYDKSKRRAIHIGLVLKGDDGFLRFCESHGDPSSCDKNLQTGPSMSIITKLDNADFMTVRILPK